MEFAVGPRARTYTVAKGDASFAVLPTPREFSVPGVSTVFRVPPNHTTPSVLSDEIDLFVLDASELT